MPRVKRSLHAKKKRRNVLEQASGYWGLKSKVYRRAKEQVLKSGNYAYRDRRVKKRTFRGLWVTRIGAAAKLNGLSYSQLMHGLKKAGVELDRKVLAEVAVVDASGFSQIAATAKSHLGA